jgi:hypothetical protein
VNLGSGGAAEAVRPPQSRPDVAVVVTYERDGQARPLPVGGVLTANDRYRVTFTPSEASYVYVYQVGPNRAQPIFPSAELSTATNPVKARQTYDVPSTDQWLRLDETPGDGEIVVVAARHELTDARAIAMRGGGQRLTSLTRGPAAAPRGDVGPEPLPGVVAYRFPFKQR